jgi:hypothetical protein
MVEQTFFAVPEKFDELDGEGQRFVSEPTFF